MTVLAHSESVDVDVAPEALYDLVSDVTRTGEWSPVCASCWWDEGDGPRAGAWFTGRNVTPHRTWDTRSQVVVADRGREFAWQVGGALVRWSFALEAVPGGTRLTEAWEFLPDGLAFFRQRYGEEADDQIADRSHSALSGIPVTLARIKEIAERGPSA